jgi:hypothetical protein
LMPHTAGNWWQSVPLEGIGRREDREERLLWDESAEGSEIGGVSPTLQRFLVSGPCSQFSEVFMLARVFFGGVHSAGRQVMVFKALRMLSVCQFDGPL